MGKAQTLQAMSNRNRQQVLKASESSDSLSRRTPSASPKNRETSFGRLPLIQGVSKLTRTEVRSDLEEIEVLANGGLLVALEDIRVLPSVYPVKPRLELKIPEHLRAAQRAQQLAAGEDSQGAAGELLEFLRLVEVVRPDILDGEREREQLECKYMAIRDNYIAESLCQGHNNKQRYQFLRALQLLLCRSISQYSIYGHHASMLSDLLTVLEEKSAAVSRLEDATKELESIKSSVQAQPAAYRVRAPETSACVAVKRSDGSVVLLQAGMRMDTPFGAGVVRSVRLAGVKAVEIGLQFGMLYASPAEAVQWFSFVNDESCAAVLNESEGSKSDSNRFLVHRWQEERRGLFLPLDVQRNVLSHPEVVARVEAEAASHAEKRLKTLHENQSELLVVDSTQLTGDIVDSGDEMDVEEEREEEAAVVPEPALTTSANGLLDSLAREAISECLPYLFVEPESLVSISEDIACMRSQRKLYRHALVPKITTKAVASLQRKLTALQTQIDKLNSEKIACMNAVSLRGSQGSRLTQEVALTRLAMFTRRVRRRTMVPCEESDPPAKSKSGNSSANSPQQKLNDSEKKGLRRSGGEVLHKAEGEGDAVSPASTAAGGRARNLRGNGGAEKSRGGKRKTAGSGFDDSMSDAVDSSQRSEVEDGPSAAPAAGAPRSKRSRKA